MGDLDELIEAFTFAWGDTRVRSIILTGAGEKAFCAGGDVKQKTETGDFGPSRYGMFRVAELHMLIRDVPKPVIAAVVAVPHPRLQEIACAAVTVKEGEEITFDRLQEFFETKGVAKHYWPEELRVVEDFPRTPSGKIQKFKLREEVQTANR